MHKSARLCVNYPRKAWIQNSKLKSNFTCTCLSKVCARMRSFMINPINIQSDVVRHKSPTENVDFEGGFQTATSLNSEDLIQFKKESNSPLSPENKPNATNETSNVGDRYREKNSGSERMFQAWPPKARRKLDEACQAVFKASRPSEANLAKRQKFCHELESYLQKHCHESIRLELFGSSSNGFTFPESDIDICATFHGYDTDSNVSRYVLTPISEALSTHPDFYNVSVVYAAKVPIVKFHLRNPNFSIGDVSLYNRLAVENTRLLSAYAAIDERFKVLGYMFKHFMKKRCEIRRLREQTSYAYLILVIYFLQQCDPPVLPVLQEMHDGKKKPQEMIDGWNAWYYKDIDEVPQVWEGFGKNKASVGELWFSMVNFYAEQFDFEDTVVSIRRKRLVTKKVKIKNINHLSLRSNPLWKRKVNGIHWVKRPMLIEDPFDLGHNLAMSLSHTVHQSFLALLRNESRVLQDMIESDED